jgi:hypothetical protein
MQVACSRQKENQFYGFAIGMTVLAGAMTVGNVSGGAFNPAVSTGLQLVQCCVTGHCQALGYIWMYCISHFGAAALAAGCFLIIHPKTGIKQHTGADDQSERWSVLPSASRTSLFSAKSATAAADAAAAAAAADPVLSPKHAPDTKAAASNSQNAVNDSLL